MNSIMPPSANPLAAKEQTWVYTSLTVLDGPRSLKPTHVSFDHLRFAQPPRLTSSEVEIILRNGDAEQRHVAVVLPHCENETRIRIQLI
ncbi:MAG TPA: hypothetical protein VFC78_07440, partial [Tepidisphaeraceae bacterium]|nr:hypothetical protein [Tepidisphaeraceae bacterium]